MRKKVDLCVSALGIDTIDPVLDLIGIDCRFIELETNNLNIGRGLGLALSIVDREKLTLCLKINEKDLIAHKFSVRSLLSEILQELKMLYIDILMLQFPAILFEPVANTVLAELLALLAEGQIKQIGVSNYSQKDFERIAAHNENFLGLIHYNQIEVSPYHIQMNSIDYCSKQNIQIMAYRPFGQGRGHMLTEQCLIKLAEKYNATVQQIILAWLLQQNIIPVIKPVDPKSMESNLQAKTITLAPAELSAISALNQLGLAKDKPATPFFYHSQLFFASNYAREDTTYFPKIQAKL